MTKIFNFALKIKGGDREGGTCEVLRPCHSPKKFGTCTNSFKGFSIVFLFSDWLKSNHLRSKIERVFGHFFRAIFVGL